MKTTEQTITLIDTRIAEHKVEAETARKLLTEMNTEAKQEMQGIKRFEFATKMMALKDKMVFHKACYMVLEDLKKDLTND